MDSLHPESASPSELSRCAPHLSLPSPSGARGHSVSLLAHTVVLALIKYSAVGESTSLCAYTATELTRCVLCVLLYSSAVIALPVCVMSDVYIERGEGDSEVSSCDLVLSMITVQEHQECQCNM